MSFMMTPDDATGTPHSKRACIGDAMCQFKKNHDIYWENQAQGHGKSKHTVGGIPMGGANSMQQPQQPQQPSQPSAYRIQEAERAAQAQKNNEAQAISMAEFARRVAEQDASMQNNPEKDLARGLESEAQREQARQDAEKARKEEIYNKEMKQLMSEQLRLAKENDERNFALQKGQFNSNQTINQNTRERAKRLQGAMHPGARLSGQDFQGFQLEPKKGNKYGK